jgi:alkanesulfonate monooxygenase SsuD/methylene tetrahydromethanopterin reductase-like flavin-dependent oxidoreductase (luciferase family)
VDYDSRWDRTVEAIQILRKLWSAEKVSHRGRYYKFQNARIGPPPARGTIPILIGGAMEHVLERTARVADGWMASSHNHTTRDLKNSWRKIQQYAKNYGRHPESFMFAHNVYAHVSSSFKESLDETQSFFKELYGGSTPPGIGDREILGSPEDILEQVRVRVKLGIKHIIFQFPFNNLGKLRKFGREVMPLLKKHFK